MRKIFSSSFIWIKKNIKLSFLFGIVVIVGLWFVFNLNKKPANSLVFAHPEYRDLVKTLELTGSVDAEKKARLRFLAGGKITYLGAQEGDWVKQWQTIATIDQRDLQKRLEKSLNSYMQQRWDWEDLRDEVKDESLDAAERRSVDKQQWTLDNTVIDVELQDIAVSQSVMSAPFGGILLYSPVSTPLTQVIASDYFEIVDPGSLIFRAEVNEEDVPLIKVGQPAIISLDAYPNSTINSKLSFIAYQSSLSSSGTVFLIELPLVPDFTSSSNPFEAKALLDKYRLGMNGDVQLELEKKDNVLTVPLISIKQRDNQNFVEIKLADEITEDRLVEIGLQTEEYVEILSGLTKDDLVLIPSIN